MPMSGQVLDNCTACLRAFSAAMRMSAALLRSASDIMAANVSFWVSGNGLPVDEDCGSEGCCDEANREAGYWHTARVTTDSGEHRTVGIWPACGGLGSQREAVRTSSGVPPAKPLARQPLVAAAA